MDLEYFKIRLIGPLFEGYSGYLGPVLFEKGVSVEKVQRNQAIHISHGFSVEALNDDGEAVFRIHGGMIPATANMFVVKDLPVAKVSEKAPVVEAKNETDGADDHTGSEPVTETTKYTREELEAIADKSGLQGLRDIGDAIGVKAKSIPALIDKILSKQE